MYVCMYAYHKIYNAFRYGSNNSTVILSALFESNITSLSHSSHIHNHHIDLITYFLTGKIITVIRFGANSSRESITFRQSRKYAIYLSISKGCGSVHRSSSNALSGFIIRFSNALASLSNPAGKTE